MQQTSSHALFGVKFLLAMAVFYFASGLVGRGQGTQWIRNDRAKWLTVTIGLAVAIVLLSGWMRQLHTGPNIAAGGGVLLEEAEIDVEAPSRYQDDEAGSRFRAPEGGVILPGAGSESATPAAAE